MSDVLSHTVGSFPWALVNGDWTLRKMNKAALARQKQVLPAETIPELYVTITDGMTSLVQKMKDNDQTFFQHADSALTHILHEGVRSHRIDFVFATYREDSIKNAEISNIHEYCSKHGARVTGCSNGESFLAARSTN